MIASDVHFATAEALARELASGELGAVELTHAALRRISQVDTELNAFRVVRPEQALAEADNAQQRLQAGERAPLLGIPIAVKDDVDLAGEVTAKGTRAHNPSPVDRDGEMVRRLRSAGAVILGKTNVSELTAWPFTETASWGETRNPWNPQRTPGGSSGGSAVAVAAGMCALASGGDGGGSIRVPAAWCGLFGLKPQPNTVPMGPYSDAWQGLAVNGPLTRSVADAALFMDATCGRFGRRAWVEVAREQPPALTIGVWSQPPRGSGARVTPEVEHALERVADLLRSAGHHLTPVSVDLPVDALAQFAIRMLRGLSDDLSSMHRPDLVEARVRTLARIGRAIPAPLVRRARSREPALAARIDRAFQGLQLILTPGPLGGPWKIGELADRSALQTLDACGKRAPFQPIFNASGHPACVVPAGCDRDGLPLGVQLVAPKNGTALLLQVAAQLEREGLITQRPPEPYALR